jgi:signal transduction histidine kinase
MPKNEQGGPAGPAEGPGGESLDNLTTPKPEDDGTLLPPLYQELLQMHSRLMEQTHQRAMIVVTAAHKLKTPLAVISGYLELLLTEKPGTLSDRQRQILQDSRSNCEFVQRFVQDFLNYTSLETGRIRMRFVVGDLRVCLQEAYDLWLPRFHRKGVALYLTVGEGLQPFSFDYYKIEEVVSNLLENSLKFTPPSGSVGLFADPYFWERRNLQHDFGAQERRQQVKAASNAVRVTVADSGPGIPPEYHQEIFDDFFKLPPALDQSGGAGLGLAIARRLVQAHGGKIWVESDPGAGSKFCFLLPLEPNPNAAPYQESRNNGNLGEHSRRR